MNPDDILQKKLSSDEQIKLYFKNQGAKQLEASVQELKVAQKSEHEKTNYFDHLKSPPNKRARKDLSK